MGRDPATRGTLERMVIGHGGNPPGQGPFITLRLYLKEGLIQEASYETYQCPGCHACGKALCEMVRGMSISQAQAVKHQHVVERVGPLPAHRRHCYGLALLALADALNKSDHSISEIQ